MKKKAITFLNILTVVLANCFFLTSCGSDAESTDTLVVLNYGKYIEADVLKRFEKETGIKVKYEEYESVEDMYAKYKAGSINYDVICTSDYMIETMRNEGELIPIDYNSLPNYKNIDPAIIEASEAFDPNHKYTVPYFYGTVGILYNTKMVDEETVSSWKSLWDPAYKNQIVMINSQRDAFMVAQEVLGYDINTADRDELDATFDLLCDEKHYV
ncbi:MAG: spermidine/putrescine ABC transporter substrate-binding protein [Pseudobutyrivibrio sp.]|nr:spermidine/putrescine ABC transporter substrate-binding protein [Pseudobutyrivibrio sp.]